MKRPFSAVAAVATCALLLAACGGGGAAPASTSASSSPATSTAASRAPASAAASSSAAPSARASAAASRAPSSSEAASGAAGGQMTPLVVSYSAIIGNVLPVWVAEDAGIFKKNGLDVDLRYINSSKGIPALISGGVQIADIGGAETLSAVAGGADLATVAVDAPTYPFVLMAPSSIKTVQDLKGKKIGVSEPGSSSDIATRVALRKEGIDPDTDVSIIAVGSASERIAALENGAIQAGLSFPPNTLSLEQKGFHTVLDLASLHLPAALSSTVVKRSYLDSHKDVVQKYVDSMVESIAWAKQHKAEAVKILGKYYKNNDQNAMETTYDYFMNEVIPSLPYPKAKMYTNAQSILGAKSAKVKDYDVAKMLDASFVTSAADRGLDKTA
ncbi:MAG TPA: ABC transporter substrate-binding protein [Chloroflexota bacterium]|nr:ABC transporter substrate-binding protein [Chloroflexota bacterium]